MKRPRILVSIVLIIFVVIGPIPAAIAQSADTEDVNRAYDGLIWAPDGLTAVCQQSQFIGGNNPEIIWKTLRTRGLSEVQAAGVMGNLQRESDFLPTAVNARSGATGIAQWLGSRLQRLITYGELQGLDPFTLSVQLDFLWFELTGEPAVEDALGGGSERGAYEDLLTRTNVNEAAASFAKYYERYTAANNYTGSIPPGAGQQSAYTFAFNSSAEGGGGLRIDYAEAIYSAFSGSAVPDGVSSAGCVSSPLGPVDFSANPDVKVEAATKCIGGALQPGLATLRQYILDRWSPPVTSITNRAVCRDIVGGSSISVHAEGRAIDIMISALDGQTLAVGDQIRDWLIINSTNLGMQRVIWNRYTWSANRDGWRDYCAGQCTDEGGDRNPHTDHLHVELNWEGAEQKTPFFTVGAGR